MQGADGGENRDPARHFVALPSSTTKRRPGGEMLICCAWAGEASGELREGGNYAAACDGFMA